MPLAYSESLVAYHSLPSSTSNEEYRVNRYAPAGRIRDQYPDLRIFYLENGTFDVRVAVCDRLTDVNDGMLPCVFQFQDLCPHRLYLLFVQS